MFARSQQNQVDTAREERAGFFWTHFKYKLNTMRDFVQVHFSHFVPMQYGKCVYCDSLLAVLSLSSLGHPLDRNRKSNTLFGYIA